MKMNLHIHGKFFPFFDHIGDHSGFLTDGKILDLCQLASVLQHLRIQVQLFLHTLLFLYSCSLLLCLLRIVVLARFVILIHQNATIQVDHFFRIAFRQLFSFVQQNNPVTVFSDTAQVMAYKQNGFSHFFKFFKLPVTFCLEKDISYGKSFPSPTTFISFK